MGDSSGATEAKLKRIFSQAKDESPAILLLRNVHLMARNRDGDRDERVLNTLAEELQRCLKDSSGKEGVRSFLFLICDTDAGSHDGTFDEGLASLFEHRFDFDDDDDVSDADRNADRRETLEWLICCENGRSCVDEGIK